jgi:hypothetical protein
VCGWHISGGRGLNAVALQNAVLCAECDVVSDSPHDRCLVLDAYVAVDALGTFSETKRQVGLLRMLQLGVIVSDYATLMVEILKDNARPEAGEVYGAMDMGWAKLVGQVAHAYGKQTNLRAARLRCVLHCRQLFLYRIR